MKSKVFGITVCAMMLLAMSGCPKIPAVSVSSSLYDFGTDETDWEFEVWNGGESGSTLQWTASADKDWILLANKSGTSSGPYDADTIKVRIDREQFLEDEKKLQANGTITISSDRGGYAEVIVKVSELLPELGASPTSLNFGTSEDVMTFQIYNSGDSGTELRWAASVDETWVNLSQRAGTINDQTTVANVNVSIDRDNFTFSKADTYEATITVTATDQDPIEIQVLVTQLEPGFGFDTQYEDGGGGYQMDFGTTTPVYDFFVWNDGDSGAEIQYNFDVVYYEAGGIATVDPDPEVEWVVITGQVGGVPITHLSSTTDTQLPVYVTVDRGTLTAGTYYADVEITSDPDVGASATILCVMEVAKNGWIKAWAIDGEDAVAGLSETDAGLILVEGTGTGLVLDSEGALVETLEAVKGAAPVFGMAECEDKGIVATLTQTNAETGVKEIVLRKLAADGAAVFEETYAFEGADCTASAVLPVEGGYLIGGTLDAGEDTDILVIRVDETGSTNADLEYIELSE